MRFRITGLAALLVGFATSAVGQDAVTIHLAGDSTMAPKTAQARPETGWGEPFADLVERHGRLCFGAEQGVFGAGTR
jgi:hypothetical protein